MAFRLYFLVNQHFHSASHHVFERLIFFLFKVLKPDHALFHFVFKNFVRWLNHLGIVRSLLLSFESFLAVRIRLSFYFSGQFSDLLELDRCIENKLRRSLNLHILESLLHVQVLKF